MQQLQQKQLPSLSSIQSGSTTAVLAWALAGMPYQTATAALLLLAVLDVFLVSLPLFVIFRAVKGFDFVSCWRGFC